jgi:hypothetical protein
MLDKKILETTLDIDDPADIYSNERTKMFMGKLTEKYAGKCFHSCLVIKINTIIRRSFIYMQDTLHGGATVNIIFEADVIVYHKGEVINGCQIIKKEPSGILHAKSAYAGVQLNIKSEMAIYKEGDIVPVIVKMVRYNPNQTSISVSAHPFMPIDEMPVYYNIVGDLSTDQKSTLNITLTRIKDEEKCINDMSTTDKKIYKFFIDLLYNDKKQSNDALAKKVTLGDMIEIKTGIIFKPMLKYDDATIRHLTTERPSIDESPFIIFSVMLNRYLSNLQTLAEFLKSYPSFASVQKNKEIWKMYNMLK